MPADQSSNARSIEEAFWLVLVRAPSANEVRDELRHDDRRALLLRLLSSAEFNGVRRAWRTLGDDEAEEFAAREPRLRGLGPDERFLRAAYESLLGRPPDPAGQEHYLTALRQGEPRWKVLRSLALSDEFEQRVRTLSIESGIVPEDVQLCELANPAKWDNEQWLDILRSLGLSDDKRSMHRKPYEFAQLVFGCRRLGALREDSSVISIGAGHELVLYWLANHAARVIATDMYEGVWQDVQGREGNPDVIERPDGYAPFAYRTECLTFMKMDGRRLAFRDGTFDIAYSLSSIEHFGGMAGAAATVREMARVLKPGGVLALATEYVLDGPVHPETFRPHEIGELIDQPGLELVQPIDESVYRRYTYTPVDLYTNPYQTPHMVVRFNDTVFTTVMVFLRRVG